MAHFAKYNSCWTSYYLIYGRFQLLCPPRMGHSPRTTHMNMLFKMPNRKWWHSIWRLEWTMMGATPKISICKGQKKKTKNTEDENIDSHFYIWTERSFWKWLLHLANEPFSFKRLHIIAMQWLRAFVWSLSEKHMTCYGRIIVIKWGNKLFHTGNTFSTFLTISVSCPLRKKTDSSCVLSHCSSWFCRVRFNMNFYWTNSHKKVNDCLYHKIKWKHV